jgi:hypothetical protein
MTNQPLSTIDSPLDPQATSPQTTVMPPTPGLRPLDLNQKGSPTMSARSSRMALSLLVIATIAGVGTGFGLHKLYAWPLSGSSISTGGNENIQQVAGTNIKNGEVFGKNDESTFKDKAQGYLVAGGIDGEGSHRLLREGGESQTVYLTSSITDLDKFIDMEVKVSGETFKGQKAGWLMDVGRVEVIETKGTPPEGAVLPTAGGDEGGE